MRLRLMRTSTVLALAVCSASFFGGCASQSTAETEPTPQSIRLPDPQATSAGEPATIEHTVKKDLFNIQLSTNGMKVNDALVADLEALKELLGRYPDPVITIATHRCYSGERAAKVISLAQEHTTTPIALGSYGSYDDPQCE